LPSAQGWSKFLELRRLNKMMVIPALAFLMEGEDTEYQRVRGCGNTVYSATCTNCGTKHFSGFWRCKSRWCLNCSHVKQLIWIARIKERVEQLSENYYVCMLNLTIRDGSDITERLKVLERAWRCFQHDDLESRKMFKKRFLGGVRSLEVKRGKNSGMWHPHYHCLLIIPKGDFQKDYDWVKASWKKVTDDQGSVFFSPKRQGQSVIKAICEVLKYIVKPEKSVYEDAEFEKLYWVLKGRRQTNTWGLLRGLAKLVETDSETITEKKLEQFICSKCGCTVAELEMMLFKDAKNDLLYDVPVRLPD
jgi:hypothetical protein